MDGAASASPCSHRAVRTIVPAAITLKRMILRRQVEDTDVIFDMFKKNPLLRGITFSGGEPFCQPKPLLALAKQVHALHKDVTAYSGWK